MHIEYYIFELDGRKRKSDNHFGSTLIVLYQNDDDEKRWQEIEYSGK